MYQSWTFAIDRGGTFTDVVARSSEGRLRFEKLLSEIRALRGRRARSDPARPGRRRRIGRRSADGHDGRHQRAARAQGRARRARDHARFRGCAPDRLPGAARDLRAAHRAADDALRPRGRDRRAGDVDGEVLVPLDEAPRARRSHDVRDGGIDALAIVLMHGWRLRAHEARLAEMARELGFTQVSVSHEVAPLIKLIGRGDTTVVDAYLSPVLRRYVDRVAAGLAERDRSPFHAVERRPGRRDRVSRQGRDPVRACRAASSAWSRRARRTAATG